MSSLASGNRRRTAVASTWEAEWRSSSSGVIDMADMGLVLPTIAGPKARLATDFGRVSIRTSPLCRLLLQWLQLVAVLAVEHGPAGGGQLLAQNIGPGPVLGLLRRPALVGEGGDFSGHGGFGGS